MKCVFLSASLPRLALLASLFVVFTAGVAHAQVRPVPGNQAGQGGREPEVRPGSQAGQPVRDPDGRRANQAGQAGRDSFDVLPIPAALLDSIVQFLGTGDSAHTALSFLMRSREFQRTVVDSGFVPFGRDAFTRGGTQFDANLTGPVDEGYRLGPGDRIAITLTGEVEASYDLQLTRDGYVVIPHLPAPLHLANLTKAEATEHTRAALGRVYAGLRSGGRTRMLFTVAQLGTRHIVVTGDVVTPGSVRVPNSATMFTALYQAGGPTETGSLRRIELKRAGRTVGTLDVYDYLLYGSSARDLRLESGDILFVPPRGGRVRIAGAVLRPGIYELKSGETLEDAIRMAGGFRHTADQRRVQIERYVPPAERTDPGRDRRILDVSSSASVNGELARVLLEPGDLVRISEVSARVTAFVTMRGNVWQEGMVAFEEGMRLSDALRRAGGVKPDTYLEQVNISRLNSDSTRRMLRVALSDTVGGVRDDIALQDFDEIQVFSRSEFRPQRYVSVGGAVRNPGQVPHRDGMTIRDLVLEAGGLLESAYLGEAEIARLPEQRGGNVAAVTIRVPLDSTYLFDRGADGRYLGPPGTIIPQGRAPEVTLRPYDAITIKHQSDWGLTELVHVHGEVRFPSTYAIVRRDERIADIIRRAGGLSPDAYVEGVTFVRKRDEAGRIGVDLKGALSNPRHPDNLRVMDGDSIFIPTYNGVVTVRGAVNNPVAVSYVSGKGIDYYVRAAGGNSASGDLARAFVTQPNGKLESKRSVLFVYHTEPRPKPGSIVEVPAIGTRPQRDLLALVSTTSAILSTAITTYLIIRSL